MRTIADRANCVVSLSSRGPRHNSRRAKNSRTPTIRRQACVVGVDALSTLGPAPPSWCLKWFAPPKTASGLALGLHRWMYPYD